MKRLVFLAFLFLTVSGFSQNLGDCLKPVYQAPVVIPAFMVVELEPAVYESYVITPAVVKTIKTSEAVYDWQDRRILVKNAHTDMVKSNCDAEWGCSWKKVAVPAVYRTIQIKRLVSPATYEDVIATPAVVGRKLIRAAVVTKIATSTITEGGKVELKTCDQ